MKFRGLIDCHTTQTFQVAVLNYEGIPSGTLPGHTIQTWAEAVPDVAGQVSLKLLKISKSYFSILQSIFPAFCYLLSVN